ncbi:AfsR/SARP family transcriptional regulator [Streptomyces sp. NBC_00503]|uniref:AfsR/SARP family transcriptional regulator n=1 Tax=Streptomyces sp. NBC_00503 TaxID=2903659 RepID=UPI002E814353|nr:BTAD domain-containing putative transcriptional regulator [Streptomyces sp. NBC_00503]
MTAEKKGVPLGGARQRTILALLLLTPGRVVPVDAMVDAVWNDNPPTTARTQVAICVAALRKIFKSAGIAEDVIVTAHPGYVLRTEGHRFDSVEFTSLVQAAEQAAQEGLLPEAAHGYAQAVSLWRGPAFTGVGGRAIEDEAERLEEHRLNAYDDSTLVHLELGRHQELIPGLAAMVREHPLRERTRHHLMLAQYRSGRRADAMETFRDARRQLIDELGIEPGPDLQELHDAILRDDPSLAPVAPPVVERKSSQAPAAAAVPSELPPDVPAFTGRTEELAGLASLLTGAGDDRSSSVGLITGPAGIGKSGLATHWAVGASEQFPDGQLFADLRGYDEQHEPATAHEILSRFLRSLGVPGEQIPADPEERVSLYRSLLTDRRVLIVLDNARTYTQIRPLLPGGGQCCVLVTSRDQMEDLVAWPSQARVHLGLLSEAEAVELLTTIVGDRKVATARADAVQLVKLCDRLPLALRIAAARLASKPHWTVRYLVSRLSDERRRLDELSQGESQVRASFALSYRYLPDEAARLFRRLGLLDVPDFTAWAAAAVLNNEVFDAELLVEALVDAQFLDVVGIDATGQLRYRFHNLLRLYASERARQDEPEPDRLAATTRFLRTLLTIAEDARRREAVGNSPVNRSSVQRRRIDSSLMDDLLAAPLEWYEAERLALVASVRQAARMGLAEIAWDLTISSTEFLATRSYSEDRRKCCDEALAAAHAAGDLLGQGAMHYSLGALEMEINLEAAVPHFDAALRFYGEAGHQRGRASTLRCMAMIDRERGNLDTAMEHSLEALPIFRVCGDLVGEAHILNQMAEIELERGRPESAMRFALDAIGTEEGTGAENTRALAQAVHRLGRVQLALGQLKPAEESFLRTVRMVKEKSDMLGLAHALLGLGETRLATGQAELAEATLADALEIAEDNGTPLVAGQINLVLGEVCRQLGRPDAARGNLLTAQERFSTLGATMWERRATDALGALVE